MIPVDNWCHRKIQNDMEWGLKWFIESYTNEEFLPLATGKPRKFTNAELLEIKEKLEKEVRDERC